MLEHNGAITQGKGFLVDDLTDHAMASIDFLLMMLERMMQVISAPTIPAPPTPPPAP